MPNQISALFKRHLLTSQKEYSVLFYSIYFLPSLLGYLLGKLKSTPFGTAIAITVLYSLCGGLVFLVILSYVGHVKRSGELTILRQLGVRDSSFWSSITLLGLFLSFCASTGVWGSTYGLHQFSVSLVGLLTIQLSFVLLIVAYAQFWASLFSKPLIVQWIQFSGFLLIVAVPVLWSIFPSVVLAFEYENISVRIAFAFVLPWTQYGKLWAEVWKIKASGQSLDWTVLSQSPFPNTSIPSPVTSLVQMWISSAILVILAWYLNQIWPSCDGYSLPPNFPFQKQYWVSTVFSDPDFLRSKKDESIVIKGLSKTYTPALFEKFEKNIAVDSFTYTMEKGNIYALLGSNGAGKTSLIKMLTGMSRPTSGDAFFFGNDIYHHISSIRTMTGVCAQEDIFLSGMNATELIEFYCKIRGVDLEKNGGKETYTHELLSKVSLENEALDPVSTFSGGMKRRLSFILATIGSSKVIVLDEPSKGLDPISQTQMKKEISELRKKCIVILVTHSMEEAEYLADRICIMHHAKLCVEGTALSLKSRFQFSHTLTLVAKSEYVHLVTLDSIRRWCILYFEQSKIAIASEASVSISVPRTDLHFLTPFLTVVESDGMLLWSINSFSLEDVFLRVISDHEASETIPESRRLQLSHESLTLPSLQDFIKESPSLEVVGSDDKQTPTFECSDNVARNHFNAIIYKLLQQLVKEWMFIAYLVVIAFLSFYISKQIEVKYSPILLLLYSSNILLPYFQSERSSGLLSSLRMQGLTEKTYWLSSVLSSCAFIYIPVVFVLGFGYLFGIPSSDSLGSILTLILLPLMASSVLIPSAYIFKKIDSSYLALALAICPLAIYKQLRIQSTTWALYPPFGLAIVSDTSHDFTFRITSAGISFTVSMALFGATFWFDHITFWNPRQDRAASIQEVRGGADATAVSFLERDKKVLEEIKIVEELEMLNQHPGSESIRLVHLSKLFGEDKLAADDLTLRVGCHEIFGLLGPNGAGKSTVLSMIHGEYRPTVGRIYLSGEPVKGTVRVGLGVCSQKDSFFPNLSVYQHLKMFCLFHGVPTAKIELWISYLAKITLLDEHLGKYTSSLSGGMKRRLCLAIALVGQPKTLILDEPTSGLDPGTRRIIWDAIKRIRRDPSRSIVLTTHSMEEADKGRLEALGTPMELKHSFGNAIKLGIAIRVQCEVATVDMEEQTDAFVKTIIFQVIDKLVPHASLISETRSQRGQGNEIQIFLEFEISKQYMSEILSLFSNLEKFCEDHGILEWHIHDTSVTEVFERVIQMNGED